MNKKSILIPIAVIVLGGASAAVNYEAFVFGGKPHLVGACISLGFVAVWIAALLLMMRSRKITGSIVSSVYWLLTVVTAVLGLLKQDVSVRAPLGFVFDLPFYGWRGYLPHNAGIAILLVLSCLCTFFFLFILIRNKRAFSFESLSAE